MTNRILQTDLDLAKRLIEARHTDEEIVYALTRRRIDDAKAKQVVSALRAGFQVQPEIEINYELGQGIPEQELLPSEPQAYEPVARRRHSASSGRGKAWLLFLVLILLAGGALAFFLMQSGKVKSKEPASPTSPPAEHTPGEDTVPAGPPSEGAPENQPTAPAAPTPSPQ